MRFSIYEKLKEMPSTLSEAFQYMKCSDDREVCIQLCVDSLEFIKVIKEKLIENKKSIISDRLIKKLELISDKVNFLVNEYKNDSNVESTSIDNLLGDVRAFQSYFEQDVKVVFQIVFFAELGQKWDSMNSVYEAFKKRIDCDVKVVLTPIFRAVEKKGGKIETDVIYEDYLTTMGIENIPYESYDLSKELPDLAFISNPYESVTLPQFWPENIAKYTKLVYLPYYTGLIIDSNSIQVHCQFPVAKYAWRIIAQSRKIKELHQEYSPQKGRNVLVTGLPKWDQEFSPLKDRNVEWDRKMNNKKVFLWNTHYDVTSNNATLLEYGKDIIEFFSNKEHIGLIWRPHPMTETIFKLYQPQYYSEWEQLKKKVEESENMILDKNASSNISFYYSNAFISDYSSMLAEYLPTGKPILWTKKTDENKLAEYNYLISINNLEQATSFNDIKSFIGRISRDIDLKKTERLRILQEQMLGLDGEIGDKVCKLIMNDLRYSN